MSRAAVLLLLLLPPPAVAAEPAPGLPAAFLLQQQGEAVVRDAEQRGCADGGQHFRRLRAVTSRLDLTRRGDRAIVRGWTDRLARACR